MGLVTINLEFVRKNQPFDVGNPCFFSMFFFNFPPAEPRSDESGSTWLTAFVLRVFVEVQDWGKHHMLHVRLEYLPTFPHRF